jgi:hypothetical protein
MVNRLAFIGAGFYPGGLPLLMQIVLLFQNNSML